MSLNNWQPKRHHVLCSKHFEENCIQLSSFRRRLRPYAVPTLFTDFPKYLQVNQDLKPTDYKKKKKISASRTTTAYTDTSGSVKDVASQSDTGDKYDALGKFVASEVRELDKQQRILVEKIIYELISVAKMGSLNVNSKLVLNNANVSDVPEQYDDDTVADSDDTEKYAVKMDIGETEYYSQESCVETKESEDISDGVCGDGVPERNITSEDPADIKQEYDEVIIKVEHAEEEDLVEESEPDEVPHFEEILIKEEAATEDESMGGDLKTEFVINKQQSSIQVYRSNDAKRRRTDGAEEAEIHLELQNSNVKR